MLVRTQTIIHTKIWLIIILSFFGFTNKINAQLSKSERAIKYYHQKKYAKAIPLLEKVLSRKPSNSIRLKLARSYAKINNHDLANKYFKIALESKKINPDTYLNYAASLIAVGNYAKANELLLTYQETVDEESEESIALILACNSSTSIPSYFHIDSTHFLPINSKYNENSPVFFENDIIFSSDRPSGLFKLKSGTSGHGLVQIYKTNKNNPNPKKFPTINKAYLNTANASFDSTGTMVYFTQNSVQSNKSNIYSMQLFAAHLEDGNWVKDGVMSFCRNGHNYMHPAISSDGKHLYFVSDKPGGIGGTDIYVVHKTTKGWSKPENLGANVNTEQNEGFPFMDTNGKLYFCSKGHNGFGGFDVFISETRNYKDFSKSINLGAPINSFGDDISFSLSKDRKKGLFSSSRNNGDDDIYLVEINNSND